MGHAGAQAPQSSTGSSSGLDGRGPSAANSIVPADQSVIDRKPRYDVESAIGSGAQGHVYRAFDRDLSRYVAMKVLRSELASDPERVSQFFAEARRTGALEHACIPAVYEVGTMSTGEPFFTMRLIEGRTLFDVFEGLRRSEKDTVESWSTTRLVQLLLRIAHTVEYAHGHGLIHRDLKPSNVALAAHEEVLVLDWGLSKRVEARAKQTRSRSVILEATLTGEVKGTPLYMAPEQARGEVDRLERRTDVFALGALLYEILCLRPPYEGTTIPEVVRNARSHRIAAPSARTPDREIPAALEETAMKALSRRPEDRHATAAAFADELQRWLDGSRDRDARRREAASLVRVAIELVKKAGEFRSEAHAAVGESRAFLARAEPWWPASEKAPAWEKEDLAVQRRGMADQAEARAIELASSALAHEPSDPTARELLARIYLRMHVDAVEREDAGQAEWLGRMVRMYDDGNVASTLRDDGRLSVAAEHEDAFVTLIRVEERGRRLVPVAKVSTQPSPALWEALPHGLYVAKVRAMGRVTATVPLRVRPGSGKGVVVHLIPEGRLPEGFIYVPAGPFLAGTRRSRQEITLPGFLLQRTPVLLRDFALWLDELWRQEPDEAQIHVPWTPMHGPLLHRADDRYVFCPAGPLAEQPVDEHPDLPVVGVSRSTASQYAAWFARRIGRPADLPTEMQWEKAARGADAREYPWGNRFDPTFCSMFHSTKDRARLRPAGSFPADESPWGALDMAGNVREWCRDDSPDAREAVARGGAWNCRASDCRVTTRWMLDPQTRAGTLGFRLCLPLDESKESLT